MSVKKNFDAVITTEIALSWNVFFNRRKVIDLDDLLTDYYEAINKVVDCKPKNKSFCKGYNSDEDEKTQRKKERMLSKFVENCEKQVSTTYVC